MNQKCKDKKCTICEAIYSPTSRNQKRCHLCRNTNNRGEAPKCFCGCGDLVNWSRRRNNWGKFKQGHHKRLEYKGVAYDFDDRENPNKDWGVKSEIFCKNCGVYFLAQKNASAVFCTIECLHDWLRAGNANKDRIYKECEEYRKYKWVNSPYGVGSIREHILFMEQIIGRRLDDKEVVHHVDNDPINNEISNLFLFHCESCHQNHHNTGKTLKYEYYDTHSKGQVPKTYNREPKPHSTRSKKLYRSTCKECGKVEITPQKNRKYCGQVCYHLTRTGENHPNYTDGKYVK